MKQRIIPNLWLDDQAEEAAALYTSLFNGSAATATYYQEAGSELHGHAPGSAQTVDVEIAGYRIVLLNGGQFFKITPAISFFVTCKSRDEIDELWERLSEDGAVMMPLDAYDWSERLSEDGAVMMPLDAYDWSERYGWVQDRFGMTWQLSLGNPDDVGQKIAPSFLFVGDQFGRAEEAVELYTSVFPDSDLVGMLRYEAGEPGREGIVKYARFRLGGEVFMAMDGPGEHPFTFSEGVSLIVPCRSQEEIDHYWEKLSEGGDPSAQQCGWLKDRFGVSWQIVPERLYEMLKDPDSDRVGRVTEAFLQMKKFDVAELERAYEGADREVA
jgi:predicted 3-demethylubiquinone-9 3-methyltransferase (glyoxalase superfamily)